MKYVFSGRTNQFRLTESFLDLNRKFPEVDLDYVSI